MTHRKKLIEIALLACCLLIFTLPLNAEEEPEGDLVVTDLQIVTEVDLYGQTVQKAEGILTNRDGMAYQNITLFADVFDETAEDIIIGEGIGFLVDACGTGMLPDFALQPQESQAFSMSLELFKEGTVGQIEVFPQATYQLNHSQLIYSQLS